LLSSACRKACSEADEPLPEVSVDVELPPLLLVPDPLVVDVLDEAGVPAAVEAVAVDDVLVEAVVPVLEAVVADDVVDEALEPVNALTSAWKSCCSFASVAASGSDDESDEVEDGEELADDEELEEDEPLEEDPDEVFAEEPARSCSRF
jgi:hypothetical protein